MFKQHLMESNKGNLVLAIAKLKKGNTDKRSATTLEAPVSVQ
jgi:hypothetical protein